jgi:hypothetical protein
MSKLRHPTGAVRALVLAVLLGLASLPLHLTRNDDLDCVWTGQSGATKLRPPWSGAPEGSHCVICHWYRFSGSLAATQAALAAQVPPPQPTAPALFDALVEGAPLRVPARAPPA